MLKIRSFQFNISAKTSMYDNIIDYNYIHIIYSWSMSRVMYIFANSEHSDNGQCVIEAHVIRSMFGHVNM